MNTSLRKILSIFIIVFIFASLFSCKKSEPVQETTSAVATTNTTESTETETSAQPISYTFDKKSNTLTIDGSKTHALTKDRYQEVLNKLHEKNLKTETVILTEGVEVIESYTFNSDKYMKNLVLPASLSMIGNRMFYSCDSLENITVNPQNQYYATDSKGVLYTKDMATLIVYPSALPYEEYTMPETITSIYDNAFYICPNLKVLHMSPNLTGTFTHWFYCCDNLGKVTFPADSLNYRCDEQGVVYTKDTNKIVFVPADLRTLVISGDADSFFSHAMINNELITEIVFDNTTVNMENYIHQFTNLKKFTIKGEHPDYTCLDGVLYSKDKTKLIWYPPMKDGKTFTVPDKVEYICHVRSKLAERIIIPDSVKIIDNSAFLGCDNLRYVNIGKGLEKFDYNDEFSVEYENVFSMCENLKKITVDSDNKNFKVDKYGALCTADMKNIITLPANGNTEKYIVNDSVIRILDCFENCKNLKKLHIGSDVEYVCVGEADTESIVGFAGCTSLEEITVSEKNENYTSVDGILYSKDKTKLCLYPADKSGVDFYVPDSVERIGDFAFYQNQNLKRIYAGTYTESNLIFNFTDYQKDFQLPLDIYYSCKKEDYPHDYLRDNPRIHFEAKELPEN